MAERRAIRINGITGRRYTSFPFFATDKDKKEIARSRLEYKIKLARKSGDKAS